MIQTKRPKDLKITYKKDNISLNKKLYNNFNNNLLKKNNIVKNKFIPILLDIPAYFPDETIFPFKSETSIINSESLVS